MKTSLLELLVWLKEVLPIALVLAVLVMRRVGASDEKVRAVQRAGQLVEVYVGSADAVARELKNPATHGTFTPEEGAALKADVLRLTRKALGPDGLKTLQAAIGAVGVDEFLDHLTESKVTALRTAHPAPVVVTAAAAVQTEVVEAAGGGSTTTTTATTTATSEPQAAAPADPTPDASNLTGAAR